mmetsp:Transcript_67047/g.190208  ORF Transcript_67047/g.190208 Transcript_67047/m.190208 type:complete len:229 (+) Transcript_67047:395-1081(+)
MPRPSRACAAAACRYRTATTSAVWPVRDSRERLAPCSRSLSMAETCPCLAPHATGGRPSRGARGTGTSRPSTGSSSTGPTSRGSPARARRRSSSRCGTGRRPRRRPCSAAASRWAPWTLSGARRSITRPPPACARRWTCLWAHASPSRPRTRRAAPPSTRLHAETPRAWCSGCWTAQAGRRAAWQGGPCSPSTRRRRTPTWPEQPAPKRGGSWRAPCARIGSSEVPAP